MTLTSVKPGDIVRCDVRGRVFYAEVMAKGATLEIMPIGPGTITYRTVTARQVVAHYRKSKSSRT